MGASKEDSSFWTVLFYFWVLWYIVVPVYFQRFLNFLNRWSLLKPPSWTDAAVLSLFAVIATFHPFFTEREINFFEAGLYLPGINAILHGLVPYRDFFYLRGPFELYMPAFLMSVWGQNLTVLYLYFYAGNVLCLVMGVLIAKELFRTRLILYLMVPILVARTFPRVMFTIWGGMRYALGLIALWCFIKFLRGQRLIWMLAAGIFSGLGLWTSVEIGVYAMCGVVAALAAAFIFKVQQKRAVIKALAVYLAGIFLVSFPYILYLVSHQALVPYLESVRAVVFNMQNVIDPHFASVYPSNLWEAVSAMVNPLNKNFSRMTVSYLYLAVLGYLVWRIRAKRLNTTDLFVIAAGVYGFIMYNTGFRGIWTAHFELSLQPEKILYFFILEAALLYGLAKRGTFLRFKAWLVDLFIVTLCLSSVIYMIGRYDHRFYVFKYIRSVVQGRETQSLRPLAGERSRPLTIERARGIIAPVQQADDMEAVVHFIQKNTKPGEAVFTYPELGAYHFLADRPFVGRFPIATFSWFDEGWHQELMADLKKSRPRYVILTKEFKEGWKTVYLALEQNRRKFKDVMDLIHHDYEIRDETPLSYIYKLKKDR
ncbi:MAG: hypothetical protein HYZ86_04755 [Candidatus Omnitrophica bacterium]|nr:hypothetical protein [Candidatus Omnitrophota bacterium]